LISRKLKLLGGVLFFFSLYGSIFALLRWVAPSPVRIKAPLEGAVFPANMAPPTFSWEDVSKAVEWYVEFRVVGKDSTILVGRYLVDDREWRPEEDEWSRLLSSNVGSVIDVTVIRKGEDFLNRTKDDGVRIRIDKAPLSSPILYREVQLPFIEGFGDPAGIKWRLGDVSQPKKPPVVLDGLPVCGNCHTFSNDGRRLGLDVDYANDKGSYAIVEVESNILLDSTKVITWSDYRREDGVPTFGLLSRLSPDGRYVVSTVKDRSVFVPLEDLEISQLFFPVKGILAVYDMETSEFFELEGANDPEYVQSDPSWSPDGKWVLFSRSKAHALATVTNRVLLSEDEVSAFLWEGQKFRYDVYRVPFPGGLAEPLKGASDNGVSNYFARYTPDGKWIVFCQADSYMLLQPDSEMYVVPSEGGVARKLSCNTPKMNSWHSFSPDGRWMVWSSKAYGPYTKLMLSRFHEGDCAAPLVLDWFTAPDSAANIPEFANIPPQGIVSIEEEFLDWYSFLRVGNDFTETQNFERAAFYLEKALELNPRSHLVNYSYGGLLLLAGRYGDSALYLKRAVDFAPGYTEAHADLGVVLGLLGNVEGSIYHLSRAISLDRDHAVAWANLGSTFERDGQWEKAWACFAESMKIDSSLKWAKGGIIRVKAALSQRKGLFRAE